MVEINGKISNRRHIQEGKYQKLWQQKEKRQLTITAQLAIVF